MKQTAVDFFFEKIKSNFEHDGDKLESVTFLYAICKQKEKQQIIDIVEKSRATGLTAEYLLLTYEYEGGEQ